MGLVAGRIEEVICEQYDDADEYSEGTGSMKDTYYWYDMPFGQSRLLRHEKVIMNAVGTIISKIVIITDIEHGYAAPTSETQEIYATIWLPRKGHRTGLNLVERSTRVFWYASIYAQMNGFQSWREVVEGEVIYNTTPTGIVPDAKEIEILRKQGRRISGSANISVVLDSARPWSDAVKSGGIVEESDYPQTSVWKKIKTIEHTVLETWSDVVEFTTTHNHLRPGSIEFDGPNITHKPEVRFEIPVPINPPELTDAGEVTGGVYLRADGGGGFLEPITKRGAKVIIRPDTYKFYRRIDSMPGRSLNSDPYNVWDTAPVADNKYGITIAEGTVTDVSGTPASSLPGATPSGEFGDTSEPDEASWTLVAEVDNMEIQRTTKNWADTIDIDVTQNAEYTYRATVVCNGEESEPSNEISLTYTLDTVTQGIRAKVRKNSDGDLEIDVMAPANVEAGNLNPALSDDYGETRIVKAPVDLSKPDEYSSEPGNIDDIMAAAEDLGLEIAQAQMAASQGLRRISLTPVIPILGIQRGAMITAPVLSWRSIGNDLVIESATIKTLLRVDGWGLKMSRGQGQVYVVSDPIDCLEISV